MPRKPIFPLRLDPGTKKRWQDEAEVAGLSLAAWIKRECDKATVQQRPQDVLGKFSLTPKKKGLRKAVEKVRVEVPLFEIAKKCIHGKIRPMDACYRCDPDYGVPVPAE